MKKTQIIELINTIKGSLVPYISIAVFVMLGVGIYAGINWGADSIETCADRDLMTEGKMYDLQIIYPFGFSDEDVEELAAIESVSQVEGIRTSTALIRLNGQNYYMQIEQLSKELKLVLKCEGSLPSKDGQIAVEAEWADREGVGIGDVITFLPCGDDSQYQLATVANFDASVANFDGSLPESQHEAGMPPLKSSSYTITALVTAANAPVSLGSYSPEDNYFMGGSVYICEDAWDPDADLGYNVLLLRSDSLRGLSAFSEEYADKNQDFEASLSSTMTCLCNARYRQIQSNAKLLLGDASAIEQQDALCSRSNDSAVMLSLGTVSRQCNAVGLIVALLFMLSSLLVCYSSISRLAYEQSLRIGVKKALGLSRKEILRPFILYALSAAVIGLILGIALSYLVGYIVLLTLLTEYYPVPPSIFADFGLYGLLSILMLGLIGMIAYCACSRTCKSGPLELLAGHGQSAGRMRRFERWSIWQRSSLLSKTIVNNCLNDKRRVLGTLVGISCCASLLIMGLTLNENVLAGITIQNEDYYGYNAILYFDDDVEGASDKLAQTLEQKGYKAMLARVNCGMVDVQDDGEILSAYIICPDDNSKYREFCVMNPANGSSKDCYQGAWCSVGYQNINGGPDDQLISFSDSSLQAHDVQLDGFFVSYSATGEIFLDKDSYREVYGKAWSPNCFLVDTAGASCSDLDAAVQGVKGYVSVLDFAEYNDIVFRMFGDLAKAIVGISMGLALVMAFMVVLNLLAMYIEEKRRELIVMRINGYSMKQVRKYIFADTALMLAISILIAIVLGTAVGNLAISRIECSTLYLVKSLSPLACLLGAGISILLVCLASVISMRKMDSFKLSDINR